MDPDPQEDMEISQEEIYQYPAGSANKIWTKRLLTRTWGNTMGGKDTYIISPHGKKLRSTHDLANHIKDKDLFQYVDPTLVNFEKPQGM